MRVTHRLIVFEVDPDTGKTEIVQFVAADDFGIDQHQQLVAGLGSVDHDDAPVHIYLGRSQAYARRRGLTESKCVLRDTRLVLAYLGTAALAGVAGVVAQVAGWLG